MLYDETPEAIASRAAKRAFGQPLVTNVFRGMVVEAIVASVLCPEWNWCSEDYFRFDFRHPNGTRLEVKQSAACQSWESKAPSSPRWDIGARKGYWEGDTWTTMAGRNADLYVLSWHAVTDRSLADHRDGCQWEFYVVRATDLPEAKTIGMSRVKALGLPVRIADLAERVARLV